MTLLTILRAIPGQVWWPMVVAVLACVAIAIWYAGARIRQRDAVASIVGGLVALGASVGLTVLVVATTLLTFGVGLSQRATPSPVLLLELANGVARVDAITRGDSGSLARHLTLLDAGDRRVAWAVLARLPCPPDGACTVVHGDRIQAGAARKVARELADAEDARGTPLRLGEAVAVAVPVPVRDADGTPVARILIGFDASRAVRVASLSGWGTLAFALLFWFVLVYGTKWAVAQSVSERLRTLATSLAADGPGAAAACPDAGDLASLAAAIDRAAERTLRRESQFRTIFEQAPAGIALCGTDGQVGAANPHLRRILGLADEAPVPAWETIFVDPGSLTRFHELLRAHHDLPHAAWRWRDAQGRERLVRGALVALPSATPDAAAVLLVEDESERHALETQLRRAQKMDAMGKLAGGIAHDFNNLLTVIRANVALVGRARAIPELAAIDDAAARGGRMVRRLLAITRDEQLDLAPQQIGPVLHETIALVRRIFPERIRIETPAEAPSALVALDQDAVQQALLNLMLNARDAIPEAGVVTISLEEREGARGVRWMIVRIEDTGVGMSPEVLERATEPFFTTRPADQGSGMGLAMVYGTMRHHGGRLELRSTPGTGTCAELWFPITVAPEAARTAAPGTPPVRAHLLLVDDEFAVRAATERTLRALGHEVTSVANIDDAERALAAEPRIALVVSDMMMPGGSGLDLLRRVRATGSRLPFLIVSGYTIESLEGQLGTDECLDVLPKPWTMRELGARVQRALAAPTKGSESLVGTDQGL